MSGNSLQGRVALVAGATRGAGRGIALALAEAGATVWCTGRSSKADRGRGAGLGEPFALEQRPETIEQTAEIANARGGQAFAARVDHTDAAQVEKLVAEIMAQHGPIQILVNDVWGGDALAEWGQPYWALSSDKGFSMVERVLRSHVLTSRAVLPGMLAGGGLVVEVTDGDFHGYRGNLFYDLAKIIPIRLALALMADQASRGLAGISSVALTPGFLRSEAMLDYFGVSEANWRDGIEKDPHFAQSETPAFVGRAVVALASDPAVSQKSGRVLSSWALAEEYGFDDVDGRRPHWGRHLDAFIEEILARGGPKDEGERELIKARWFQLALEPERQAPLAAAAANLGLPAITPAALRA